MSNFSPSATEKKLKSIEHHQLAIGANGIDLLSTVIFARNRVFEKNEQLLLKFTSAFKGIKCHNSLSATNKLQNNQMFDIWS